MEKVSKDETHQRRARGSLKYSYTLLLSLLFYAVLYLFDKLPILVSEPISRDARLSEPTSSFWQNITGSSSLKYHPCFDGWQCARLEVPIDWNNTSKDRKTAKIALAKIPAKVPITDSRYGGAILINPGGPGGSGIGLLLSEGKHIQNLADTAHDPNSADAAASEDIGKYFDVIGFDPRGVNNTTPAFDCFSNAFSRKAWNILEKTDGIFGTSEDAFALQWARSKALFEGCSKSEHGSGGHDNPLLEHMNTSPVVRDMVEIIERHGEWRQLQARRLLSCPVRSQSFSESEKAEIFSRTSWKKGAEKLLYIGYSYGTILGASFAAMYPEKVDRVVIDGVADAEDYYAGGWTTNLQDTDDILSQFSKYCSEAGPGNCALWSKEGAENITSNVKQIVHTMKTQPLGVAGDLHRDPAVITYGDVRRMIRNALYKPMERFPPMAQLLSDLSNGNGTSFAEELKEKAVKCEEGSKSPEDSTQGDQTCTIPRSDITLTSSAILCLDGESITGTSPDEYQQYWKKLQDQSSLLGDMWGEVRLPCVNWHSRPKWRYGGPIGAATAYPLLMIGNTYDPVTPLRNAHNTSSRFPGSRVLQQDSEGHCSVSAPSICTAKTIRDYFQHGELPPRGKICGTVRKPFSERHSSPHNNSLSDGDQALLELVEDMARDLRY